MDMPPSRKIIVFCSLLTCLVTTFSPGRARALERSGQTTFYDPTREEIYAFGGRDAQQRVTSDLFVLRRSDPSPRWRHLRTTGEVPPPRELAAGAYRPSRRELFVFGGLAPQNGDHLRDDQDGVRPVVTLGDTWRLRLDPEPHWDRLTTDSIGPSMRVGHTAIYDPDCDCIIVHGGGDGAGERFDDTWQLTLGERPTWRRLDLPDPKPIGMYGHTAVYDSRHHQMITFGGVVGDGKVWFLSLFGERRWSSCSVDAAGRQGVDRYFAAAAFDSARNSVLVFGGLRNTALASPDLWNVQVGVANERPEWAYVPLCHVTKFVNYAPDDTTAQTPLPIRSALAPRASATVIVVPHKSWIGPGEEQTVLLLFGGRSMNRENTWTLLGSVFPDFWSFIERNPAAGEGHFWTRAWMPLPVDDEPAGLAIGPPVDIRPKLSPVHQRVLDRWRRLHPGLRLMTLNDAKLTGQDVAGQQGYGPGYHPCYVVGDFNEDRSEDFAVLLIDTAKPSHNGMIAIFNGPFSHGVARRPAFLDSGYSVDHWVMWCDFKPRVRLYEGAFESDNFTWFVWKNGKYIQEAPSLE